MAAHHHYHMLDPVLPPSTELAGFRIVIVFTTSRHFVRSHASSFTSQFFFISFFTCFSTFVSVFLFLYYYSLQISKPSLSHFYLLSSKYAKNLTTKYYAITNKNPYLIFLDGIKSLLNSKLPTLSSVKHSGWLVKCAARPWTKIKSVEHSLCDFPANINIKMKSY